MQKDMFTEFHSPESELKNLQNIAIKKLSETSHALQESDALGKNCTIKLLPDKSETPSMVSELVESNPLLSLSIKDINTFSKHFDLKTPLTLAKESVENGSKILNMNSIQKPKGELVNHLVISTGNSNSANNAAKIRPYSLRSPSITDFFNNDPCPGIRSNAFKKNKSPFTLVVVEPKRKTQVRLKLDEDFNKDSLTLDTTAKLYKFRSKNSPNLEEPEVIIERIRNGPHVSSQNEPVCVISEVIGNADIFSKDFDSDKKSTSEKLPNGKNKQTDATDLQGMFEGVLENSKVMNEKIEPIFSDLRAHVKDTTGVMETDAAPSSEVKESETPKVILRKITNEECNGIFLDTSGIAEITKISETQTVTPEKTKPESVLPDAENPEIQLITPKKTNDITKIKGWRRKQFLVEKPTSVEFYKIKKVPKHKIKVKNKEKHVETGGNVENAFVCDSLDEFLDQKVNLKVNYEIPHLYAEVGIKLTSEDIASKPNLSAKDLKEVGNRYCVPVQEKNTIVDLDEIDEENYKSGKRHAEDDPKPLKILKLQDSKRLSVLQKHALKILDKKKEVVILEGKEGRLKENDAAARVISSGSQCYERTQNMKLGSKLLGLVVYPGPFQPLHSVVRYHIEKLRCYSTRIDKNWANFAASAVFTNDLHYKRKILPVRCCVKIEEPVQNLNGDDSLRRKKLLVGKEDPKNDGKIQLKQCRVVIDKINSANILSPWCMEHEMYDCEPCGLSKTKLQNFKSTMPCNQEMSNDGESGPSPTATFDTNIANLLAKKLRFFDVKEDTLTGTESLKKLVPNTVELIKLNFVKESFLGARISMWFLKQENPSSRSRAFLTFSEKPPVRNAVNLRLYSRTVMRNLPKVIKEIVYSDNIFSPNEYAILHCDGQIWEIHGSLNIAIKKSNSIEQIFASREMPELKLLREVAEEILNVRAAKWWVMDLTQGFNLIELEFGSRITIVSRNIFLESARSDARGFIPIRGNSKGRLLGVYIIKPLLPFVLMGPYFLVEPNNLTLKGERSTIPFKYFLEENIVKNSPLKNFINSAIKHVEENGKVLEGLWLYDKMCLDRTSYLEGLIRNSESPNSSKLSSIDIEHGYSLNSLTNCLPPGVTAGGLQKNDSQEAVKKVTVYLYFDIFELGYVKGELQRDNSVIIGHPLHRETKVKSPKVGDWFVRTIKRRLEFIPKDLEVKWFITKHKEDLRERHPFNKFLLSGTHILTKDGILNLLKLSESRIAELGLPKNEVIRAIKESRFIKILRETKKLAKLFFSNPEKNSSMVKVLTKAINEIKRLKSVEQYLRQEKHESEEKKLWLLNRFFQTLKFCGRNDDFKLKWIEEVRHMFMEGSCRKNMFMDLEFKKLESLQNSLNKLDSSKVICRILKSPDRKDHSPDIVKANEDFQSFPYLY